MSTDLQLALELADSADAITMRFFKSQTLSVRTKSDATPVSEADEAVERMIRERLATARPEDGIVGEEEGTSGSSARRWVVDPIDGTKNYVRGIPVFGTLLALEIDGRGEVGVVSAPALGRRWWASRGAGAFLNGDPIRVSSVEQCREAHLAYDSLTDFEKAGLGANFISLAHRVGRTRAFGDFWAHMLVAEGAMEIAIEPEVAHWDMAAIQVIVEEAGGRFTTLRGDARPDGGSGVSTNGLLHECVLEMLR